MLRTRTIVEQQRPGLLLETFVLNQLAGRLVEAVLEGSGIVGNEFAVSSWLNFREQATPSELAAELGLKATTLTSVLDRLVQKGIVRKRANPDDGRSYLVELTPKGKTSHARIGERFNAMITRVGGNLEGEPLEILEHMRVFEDAMRKTLEA